MVVRGQGVVVAELAELELLVAVVAEGSRAVSRAEVPMEYWVGNEKMGVDCNKTVFRTFIPNITYFGLMNAPPTFQRVVHLDL